MTFGQRGNVSSSRSSVPENLQAGRIWRMETTIEEDSADPCIKRGCRPSGSVSYSRHDDKASGGSPNGAALRPGRARGVTPPCALGWSKSRQRHGVGRAPGGAPPCERGSSENRQRRGGGSCFLHFLVILM